MRNDITRGLVTMLITFCFLFLINGFINWDIDPNFWGSSERTAIAVIALAFGLTGALIQPSKHKTHIRHRIRGKRRSKGDSGANTRVFMNQEYDDYSIHETIPDNVTPMPPLRAG